MSRDSLLGTFLVATILCVACSLLVSGAAVVLESQQEANQRLDKKKNVLLAAGLVEKSAKAKVIDEVYEKNIREIPVDLATGEVVSEDAAAEGSENMVPVEPADALMGVRERPEVLTVYKIVSEEDESLQGYIFPVEGKGLWSTLQGFLALQADGQTVRGITFYKHAETPGLGGEVDNQKWKDSWQGKKVYGEEGDVELDVIKGTASNEYQVDGLSGATITSNGVDGIVEYWLGENGFGPFIKSQESPAQEARKSADKPKPVLASVSAR
ncbi:MAG: Na(+)-translocating NADH-quinone reductase subunit C [Planctomycetota bacterium]